MIATFNGSNTTARSHQGSWTRSGTTIVVRVIDSNNNSRGCTTAERSGDELDTDRIVYVLGGEDSTMRHKSNKDMVLARRDAV